MSLQQFLAALRERIWLALAIFVLTVGAAVTVSLLMPKVYSASAALIIDSSKPDPLSGATASSNLAPALLATQIGIVKSERVALDVVRKLRLAEQPDQPALRAKWLKATKGRGGFELWLARDLQKSVEVTPARDSNVVDIDVEGPDPVAIARIANAFAQSYLDVSVALRVGPAQQYSSFFEEQARDLRAKVEAAQQRLSDFQKDKGVIVTDDRLESEVSRMAELSTRLTQLQGESGANAGLQGEAAGLDPRQEAYSQPMLANLRAELAHAESQLQEYGARWGDNHPQVVQAKANVASLRAHLELETRRIVGGLGAVNASQRQRIGELRNALEVQRSRVVRLKSAREEGLLLLREVEMAQRAYDGVQNRLSQSTLESHATQSTSFVLAEATPALYPISPRITVNASLAAVAGLLLAIGAVVLLELADPRLRTSEAAYAMLGQPVLGVLPKPGVSGQFALRRIPLVGNLGQARLAGPRRA